MKIGYLKLFFGFFLIASLGAMALFGYKFFLEQKSKISELIKPLLPEKKRDLPDDSLEEKNSFFNLFKGSKDGLIVDLVRGICKKKWIPVEVKKLCQKISGQEWLVIFVHGTFGSTMSLLDLPTVNNDKIEGSDYKKMIDKMRNKPIFWREQPVLARGLVPVDPLIPALNEEEALSGAKPIIKAFGEIDKHFNRSRVCRFYTYGWSGLLSQQRRRREAIRFYNELSEELDRLAEQEGIFEPKIEIIAHSHGGNLSLNLAGVYHVLNGGMDQLIDKKLPTEREFSEQINHLKQKYEIERPIGLQRRFDYFPTKKNLKIDRLIMIGTPVQPKTYGLSASEMFGQVLNIYSDEDAVQMMDYVSCCSDTDHRTFKLKDEFADRDVYQIKVSISSSDLLKGSTLKIKDQKASSLPWWKVFMGMRSTLRSSWDPTHKELWFLVDDFGQDEPEVLKPLPIAAFAPMIVCAIEHGLEFEKELDIDFSVQASRLVVSVAKHGTGDFRIVRGLPYNLVRGLRNSVSQEIIRSEDQERIKTFIKELMDYWKKIHVGG